MPYKLTLTVTGDASQQIEAPYGRCSIGRSDDNDLVVKVAGVSRRHAVITTMDGSAQIADCGSQNGTFVNGRQVQSIVELVDGDVISLGSVCDILVGMRQGSDVSERRPSPQSTPRRGVTRRLSLVAPVKKSAPGRLSAPTIALISIAAIVVVTTLVILALQSRDDRRDRHQVSSEFVTPVETVSPTPLPPCEGVTAAEIEEAARRVVGRICRDSRPYDFPPDKTPIDRIKDVVERNCRSATLGASLKKLRQGRPQLLEWSDNQILPELLAYAALAEADGGSVDPLKIAKQMARGLINVSNLLQDSNADATLLSLAAYKMGDPERGVHPIHKRMEGRINHDTERNVWALYDKRGLTDAEYDFVIRCLAFGIMDIEPKRFGIEIDGSF